MPEQSFGDRARERVLSRYPEWETWPHQLRGVFIILPIVGSLEEAMDMSGTNLEDYANKYHSFWTAVEEYFENRGFRVGITTKNKPFKNPVSHQQLLYLYAQNLAAIMLVNPAAVTPAQRQIMEKLGIQKLSDYKSVGGSTGKDVSNGPVKPSKAPPNPRGDSDAGDSGLGQYSA